ncbi:MAG: M20/M25/M40 family metallo-hydrolase [Gemmatimonadetes bacterium]|nr:M20/M25/M40 family metallo-hydrolase [Gemmatimonadota bacterium]MCB9518973.1 M20/M25/M40 family metallo-hydrolase [Gemmatimonadales bacterium]
MFRSTRATLAALALLVPAALLPAQRPGPRNMIDSARYVRTTPPSDPTVQRLWDEGMQRGQVMELAQVLLDSIGPRLTNSDRFDAGQRWLIGKYAEWGITAKQEQYGTWRKWIRGVTHMDMVFPRVRTLEAIQLAWSPGTGNQWREAEAITLPKTNESWEEWAANARGKFVLYTAPVAVCRSPAQIAEYGTEATQSRIASMRTREALAEMSDRLIRGGNPKEWPKTVGVAAMLGNNWSNYPGIDKIFGSPKDQVPTIDVSCEDYGLLYRLAENGQHPRVRLYAESQDLGEQPVHNVIATIPGTEKPNEYIVLSAHYDSWDGGSGATDNGTGTLTMLEAARILKAIYPNPKRTIIVGHWGGEEQGLNGSRAWVADHPEMVARVHAGFNQDNGTGRIQSLGPGPFPAGQDALIRYLQALPSQASGQIRLSGVGNPATGGTDNASFQCMKSPVYGAGGVSWDYGSTTWHTNRDTYDKVIAEDLQYNATLIAMLTYMADQDPQLLSHDVIDLKDREGNPAPWPSCGTGDRNTAASPR